MIQSLSAYGQKQTAIVFQIYCSEMEIYMIQIDLITGFLGSGKTTFIRQYAKFLMEQGKNIGILENDFGAVNVDAMLLQDILGDNCTLEMVAGGCDDDCHKRRFKTKLIAMGMCGYDRILVEPSGIFDMDEFFDALHENPLDRWYEIGNVITIIDAGLEENLSDESCYILASQASQAGTILFSHTSEVPIGKTNSTLDYVNACIKALNCDYKAKPLIIKKNWKDLQADDYEAILSSGYNSADYTKFWSDCKKTYDSLYFMNMDFTEDFIKKSCKKILSDKSCGNVFRIKGFQKLDTDNWISINATHKAIDITPIKNGQSILIVIGENLNQSEIEKYWGKSKDI